MANMKNLIPTSRDCTRFEQFDWSKEKFYTSINSESKNLGTICLPPALKIHNYFNKNEFDDKVGIIRNELGRAKRIWYLSPMRAAKVQASLRIRAVSPEPPLLAHTSIESRGTFRQKTRSLAPLNGWACAVKICHDGMLEDTKSLDAAQLIFL